MFYCLFDFANVDCQFRQLVSWTKKKINKISHKNICKNIQKQVSYYQTKCQKSETSENEFKYEVKTTERYETGSSNRNSSEQMIDCVCTGNETTRNGAGSTTAWVLSAAKTFSFIKTDRRGTL